MQVSKHLIKIYKLSNLAEEYCSFKDGCRHLKELLLMKKKKGGICNCKKGIKKKKKVACCR